MATNQEELNNMIRKLMRSSVATAGVAALLLVGGCASTSDADKANVDDAAEIRPFTEQGYDPTQSAPEVADVNNDGHQDTSPTAPRSQPIPGQAVVITEQRPVADVNVSYEPNADSMASSSVTSTTTYPSSTSTTTTTTTYPSTTVTTDTTATADLDNDSDLDTTTTITTQSMTSSAQADDDATPARERLRKD